MPRPQASDPAATRIEQLKEVGRYALGIEWGDRHESILPYRSLRGACPCDGCRAAGGGSPSAAGERAVEMERLGGASVFIRWADGHETILAGEELRALCRCALCAGEPERPLSGR